MTNDVFVYIEEEMGVAKKIGLEAITAAKALVKDGSIILML